MKERQKEKMGVLPVTAEVVLWAEGILEKYRRAKVVLENRLKSDDRWYRMRHWEVMEHKEGQVQPVSGWLFNVIETKHADLKDAFPRPLVQAQEEGDRREAERLSAILPVILENADFEEAWSRSAYRKLKSGTGAYAVLWDASRHNGLGDIAVKAVDILNLYWEPGVDDIQNSANLFYVSSESTPRLLSLYPQLKGKTGGSQAPAAYLTDDPMDLSDRTTVVDWYYKRRVGGHEVLHYCKYACGEVLYSTENAGMANGLYNHGQYPFILDPLFPMEGSPCGFGYIDVGKPAQEYIDRSNKAILENLLTNARPRYFIRGDGSVKESEFADMTRDFIHVDGNLGQDSVLPVVGTPLSGVYLSVVNNKIDELKETTGNRDVSSGGATGGVIAASAIAALQEAGSKLSRDCIQGSYRAAVKVCRMVIELVRQFYDLPRPFHVPDRSDTEYLTYSNALLNPHEEGYPHIPLFDVKVVCEKAPTYSRMSQNELALALYKAGLFSPDRREEALICLDMMDFDDKRFIMEKFRKGVDPILPPADAGEDDFSGGESAVTRAARLRVEEGLRV